jgi:hypothetical protein
MFDVMSRSHGNVIGLRMQGVISKDDYARLVPMVERLVKQFGELRMLCDLGEFQHEAPGAYFADMQFGHAFLDKIVKMAIVGDKRWEAWTAKLAAPFYAREARYFLTASIDDAWQWLMS